MADDGNGTAQPKVELDADGKRLQLEAEKAKYLQTIGTSRQAATPSLTSLLPTISDAPKGEVTLGEKAGALGPWRAHQVLAGVAGAVATAVQAKLPSGARVLVVGDRSILHGDWTARQVNDTLVRLTERLTRVQTEIEPARTLLANGIDDYEQSEVRETRPPGEESGDPGARGTWQRSQPGAPTPPEGAPVGVAGALGGSLDMLALLRTDYTFTAGAVSAGATELATLTAASLAGLGVAVEADTFSTAVASRSRVSFEALSRTRDSVVDDLAQLRRDLTPVESELAAIKARMDNIEKEWAVAASDAKGEKTTAILRKAADGLARQARQREKVAAPARTFIASAVALVADTDAATTSLVTPPEGGEAPLFIAARRERLDTSIAGMNALTHVLYVNLDALAADTVTRRSVLGSSGVVRFLTAGNVSWMLLDPATGAVTAGGQQSMADLLTLGLSSGNANYADTPEGLMKVQDNKQLTDPLERFEIPARLLVGALAVFLAAAGVISLVAVIALAFR